ncbi:MAG: hypothetical protein JWO51_3512 [Rhodospirillales bacterium]|nr:hypothetical protein [Rhodospirillales bacterium]
MNKRLLMPCAAALALMMGLAACTNPNDPGQRAAGGAVLGAGAGAALGAIAGGGGGAATGALIGGAVGAVSGYATTPPEPQPTYYQAPPPRQEPPPGYYPAPQPRQEPPPGYYPAPQPGYYQ